MILESAVNWIEKPVCEVEKRMNLLWEIIVFHPEMKEEDRRLFSIQYRAIKKIYETKLQNMRNKELHHMQMIIGRIRELAGYLQNEVPDDEIRTQLQVELHRLKRELERFYPELEILFNPAQNLLVWAVGNRIINAVSGDLAKRNYALLKDLLNIQIKDYETVSL